MAGEIPIVLLHGVGLDSSMWMPVRSHLRRPAVALDLPGHGTRRPLDIPATLPDFADDVLSRMPVEPVHLVGFSLGALVAQYIARFSAGRVRSMTCVSSVCRRTPAEREAVLSRLQSARDDFPGTVQRSLERWYPTGTSVSQEQIDDTRKVLERNDVPSFVGAYEVFAVGDQTISSELGDIHVPTLAVTGELDPGSTPDMTKRLTRAIPKSHARIVGGARHMLPVEAAPVLATQIRTFIERVEKFSD
jgi:pimeloyl-ACP methyl ester carboxylesterase